MRNIPTDGSEAAEMAVQAGTENDRVRLALKPPRWRKTSTRKRLKWLGVELDFTSGKITTHQFPSRAAAHEFIDAHAKKRSKGPTPFDPSMLEDGAN